MLLERHPSHAEYTPIELESVMYSFEYSTWIANTLLNIVDSFSGGAELTKQDIDSFFKDAQHYLDYIQDASDLLTRENDQAVYERDITSAVYQCIRTAALSLKAYEDHFDHHFNYLGFKDIDIWEEELPFVEDMYQIFERAFDLQSPSIFVSELTQFFGEHITNQTLSLEDIRFLLNTLSAEILARAASLEDAHVYADISTLLFGSLSLPRQHAYLTRNETSEDDEEAELTPEEQVDFVEKFFSIARNITEKREVLISRALAASTNGDEKSSTTLLDLNESYSKSCDLLSNIIIPAEDINEDGTVSDFDDEIIITPTIVSLFSDDFEGMDEERDATVREAFLAAVYLNSLKIYRKQITKNIPLSFEVPENEISFIEQTYTESIPLILRFPEITYRQEFVDVYELVFGKFALKNPSLSLIGQEATLNLLSAEFKNIGEKQNSKKFREIGSFLGDLADVIGLARMVAAVEYHHQ